MADGRWGLEMTQQRPSSGARRGERGLARAPLPPTCSSLAAAFPRLPGHVTRRARVSWTIYRLRGEQASPRLLRG